MWDDMAKTGNTNEVQILAILSSFADLLGRIAH